MQNFTLKLIDPNSGSEITTGYPTAKKAIRVARQIWLGTYETMPEWSTDYEQGQDHATPVDWSYVECVLVGGWKPRRVDRTLEVMESGIRFSTPDEETIIELTFTGTARGDFDPETERATLTASNALATLDWMNDHGYDAGLRNVASFEGDGEDGDEAPYRVSWSEIGQWTIEDAARLDPDAVGACCADPEISELLASLLS